MIKILTPIQAKILIYLFENSNKKIWFSKLTREIKGTNSCVHKNILELNHLGLIEKIEDGRIKELKLTLKGIKVARLIIKIREVL